MREDRASELSRIVDAMRATSNFRFKQARMKPDIMFNVSGSLSVSFIVVFGGFTDLPDKQWQRSCLCRASSSRKLPAHSDRPSTYAPPLNLTACFVDLAGSLSLAQLRAILT